MAKSSDGRRRIWSKATSLSHPFNCKYRVSSVERDRLWIDDRILFSHRVGKDVIQYLKASQPHNWQSRCQATALLGIKMSSHIVIRSPQTKPSEREFFQETANETSYIQI